MGSVLQHLELVGTKQRGLDPLLLSCLFSSRPYGRRQPLLDRECKLPLVT